MADLSQAELAERAGTTQPAVAAYETGARNPGLATLERLLQACDCDIELVVSPRVRRGAASLSELAGLIRTDLATAGTRAEHDATRLLFGFADDFRGSPRPGKLALIQADPPATGDLRFDAALAGLAEFFASEAGLVAPPWTGAPGRFVEPWWFVTDRPAFHAYVLANTPAFLARHGVFIAREAFDRA
jgi:transcriptional regulator with XRE-family HTH domain